MSDLSTGVGAGTLSGVDLSGVNETAPEASLPADDDRTEAAAETPTTPSDEPPAPADEPPAEEPPAEEAPVPVAKKGTPARPYVVLKEDAFEEGDESYFTKVHEVSARNAQNAMRQAFKDLSASGDTAEATLVVIPKSMFRPTKVKLNKTERVSVSFG